MDTYITGGTTPTEVRIDLLRGGAVTCWLRLDARLLDTVDAQPTGVTELVAREITNVIQVRHGRGASA